MATYARNTVFLRLKQTSTIQCEGPNEAAQLALTLRCDGWDATVSTDVFTWASDPSNFEQANVWAIKEAGQ